MPKQELAAVGEQSLLRLKVAQRWIAWGWILIHFAIWSTEHTQGQQHNFDTHQIWEGNKKHQTHFHMIGLSLLIALAARYQPHQCKLFDTQSLAGAKLWEYLRHFLHKKPKDKLLYFVWSPPWHLYILLLANLLAFYLTYFLAFDLAFYLAYLLAFYLAYLLADVLAYLLAF